MAPQSQDSRFGQRRRTRAALLAAAADLLRAGKLPSVADAAQAADISRRTAYRYFPTQEQLLTEASLETLRPEIESSFEQIENPELRIESAVRAMHEKAAENERLLRTMIRLTVEAGMDKPAHVQPASRGNRRVEWIERALAPVRGRLTKSAFSTLVSAISLCVGAEALIVLRDIRGLARDEAADVSAWSAKALLRAALAEATTSPDARRER